LSCFPRQETLPPIVSPPRRIPCGINFCESLILRIGDILCFAGTNFCDLKRLVFLAGN